MIQLVSTRPIEEIEAAVARAAQRRGGSLLATTHLGALLQTDAGDAVVFTVCQSEIYKALLAADIRFAAFLPCRIAALRRANGILLSSMSPRDFCALIHRPELDTIAEQLEDAIRAIMQDAAEAPEKAAAAAQTHGSSTWGATEDQVNMRMAVPQRIDCRGTKVEDLAGTGTQDSLGG
jgi:uncharacterized protein (DUF302 family)